MAVPLMVPVCRNCPGLRYFLCRFLPSPGTRDVVTTPSEKFVHFYGRCCGCFTGGRGSKDLGKIWGIDKEDGVDFVSIIVNSTRISILHDTSTLHFDKGNCVLVSGLISQFRHNPNEITEVKSKLTYFSSRMPTLCSSLACTLHYSLLSCTCTSHQIRGFSNLSFFPSSLLKT